ncbi:trigger factor [Kordiimonas lipolytica]|uniref:Trigger factor n=1 Tax=Kordiimonas lipolytica TaxID=1662421 RepID=A0ABV8U911_9PROT|nr:trigger factor [Kordiimonas lipolytica]
MQIEELLNEGLKREYKIVVAAKELDDRLDAILDEFRATAKIKGFRPGKAPLSLLKRMHGERAKGQVLSETMQETSAKLFEDKNIRPATRPEVDMDEYEDGKDLEYTLKVEILPEISVDDFKAPALERWVAEVDDKTVEEFCEKIAAQQKTFKKAAKTTKAAEGDAVLIDYVGSIDGVEFDGGKGEDFQLELGSGMFIPGFEDQLIGSKAGDEKTVKVTFPEQYQADDLAGKEAEFAVTVKEVRKPAEAKVDEDMAKNMGFEDLASLKESVKGQLEADNNSLTRAHMKRGLLDALADEYSFDVPAGMVDMEFRQIWEQIKRDAVMSGEAKAEDFEGQEGPEDEAEAAEFRAIAERRVRLGLLLSELGVKNNIQVNQEEVNRKIIEEARRFPGQEAQVFEFYQKNEEARAQLRAPIFEEKVVDFVLEMADVTEKTVSRDELEAAVRAIDEEEANPAKGKKAAPKKKAAAKKAPAKKAAPKKAAAKKDDAEKKAEPKKAAAKKAPAKKAAPKKAAAKKPAAKK